MKKLTRKVLSLSALLLCLTAASYAQQLTVREIMAEPSIAGTRVENERLSPDGTKVVFLWNAENKLPKDLYMVSTTGGTPQVLLKLSDLPAPPARPQTDNKLDYGLIVRDDFVKARESSLGQVSWSSDSKKLLISQSGDLYVLTLGMGAVEQQGRTWARYEANIIRRADLLPVLIDAVKKSGIQEQTLYSELAQKRADLLRSIEGGTSGARTAVERALIEKANRAFSQSLQQLTALQDIYPVLKSNEGFNNLLDELHGTENRIRVSEVDFQNASNQLKRYTKTQSGETGARFIDNDRIMYQQAGNVFVLNTADATTTQLTKDADPAKFISIQGVVTSRDAKMVAYVVSDSSKQRALFVPNYLGEFVESPTFRRGWSEDKVFAVPTDGSRDTAFEIKLPKQEGVGNIRRMVWAADNRSLIVDRNDKDTKRRQLFYIHNVGAKDEQIITIFDETDDKWQASLSVIFEPNPKDPLQLFFGSERDGYNHLYLATLKAETPSATVTDPNARVQEGGPTVGNNVTIKQLTKGNWQVEWAKWSPDATEIIFSSTEQNPAERQFYSYDVARGDYQGIPSDPLGAMKVSPQLAESGDDPMLLYSLSRWNSPDDLYVQKVCTGCSNLYRPTRLTNTVPATFAARVPVQPKFIDIPARDGKPIKSKIYLPAGFDNKKKYPMVIFVHGAGYLQNTINGWNNYYREFMFNEMLAQKGYVILDIDYRGSAGYGRDWRTDVYDFLGGKDYDDHIDAIDFMIKNYAVDAKKVGVYGGSYGGFMAEMLAFRAPEKVAAAAALRPVADWKNYYASSPGYTAQRLGFPDKNPEAYKRSSPISYADGLKTNLLILHGIVDDNVHVEDSMQLTEKLIRLGKTEYFQEQFYPSENHGFVRPESWTDEYTRILAFFEKNLK